MKLKIYCDECDEEIKDDWDIAYQDPGMTLCGLCFDQLDAEGYINTPKYTKSFPDRFTK